MLAVVIAPGKEAEGRCPGGERRRNEPIAGQSGKSGGGLRVYQGGHWGFQMVKPDTF